ncbi:tripartite tricarboxylate transporter substrate binding protein [Roseinatronobacter sp. S2]|uniref:tripartite tricarboxylate transporter substrate binding protein n=1 Tax=Roseinatronobacter sp. S2 TaxID=3035471 RepID=UPI0024106AAB|nr:tripartite tricarboxylate transporter substrate binding protein [Roseinatronobacter sp. S2]WFE76702.1 tripartite tricarboxylate transporter substrate binding protein [Roseinatronobacter sp. S2]
MPLMAGQVWPEGTVQLIVPASPGGGTDAAARILAEHFQNETGASVVVVNTPGGGGAVAAEQVRGAAPDGQTVLFFHTGLLSAYHTGGYAHDPSEAFETAAVMPVGGSYALAVNADAPWQSVEDLVAASKDAPNSLSLGIQMRGATHFMAGLFAKDSGAALRLVEAGPDADKLVQLQGGQISAALINTPGTRQYVENGDLRVLATISGHPDRDPNVQEIPSLAELGYENAVYGLDFFILTPADTPDEVLAGINAAVGHALADDSLSERFENMGMPLQWLPQTDSRERLQNTSRIVADVTALLELN